MDNEDELFEAKTKSAKKGRRAAKKTDAIDSAIPAEETVPAMDETGPMRPKKVVGGWGEDDIGTPPGTGRRRTTHEEDSGTQFTKFDDDADSDLDIPVIPDLEDGGAEDSSAQIAIAPSVSVNKVASYRDLDNDLQRTQFTMVDREIDLKLLTKYLASEAECKQDSRPWVWEHLFTEISSELTNEWSETDTETQSEAMQL